MKKSNLIGVVAATSIGIGGMIGAGIFSVLGVVASISKAAMPVSFLIGGVVVLFAAYSYVKLGVKYPSVGGAVTYLIKGFGDSVLSGAATIFLYLSYVITLALYSHGFAAYAITFWDIERRIYAVGVVIFFTIINFIGQRFMGRVETLIVGIKVGILVMFILAALITMQDPDRLSPSHWSGPIAMLVGAGVLFVGYEGFGLINNAAANMVNIKKNLPRAIYAAILITITIYVFVSLGVISNVPLNQLDHLGDSALAVAAKPALGMFGFKLIAIAALLSTSSAVNATLFGSTNVSYQIAKTGDLPPEFDHKIWGKDVEGLFITTIIVILLIIFFPLDAVAMMGSSAFLLVYTVNGVGHLKIRKHTGAKLWPIILGIIMTLTLFFITLFYMLAKQPSAGIALIAILVISIIFETAFRKFTKRSFKLFNNLHSGYTRTSNNSSTNKANQ